MTIQDQRGAISLAEKKAEAKGKKEGIESVAKNLLQTGMAVDTVAQITGLTVQQVATLEP
jgi:predicted transposase/invertase (TIGR01784 family)